ncbi:MAG: hypothetical protein R2734_21305 [Nocardioides sp.]
MTSSAAETRTFYDDPAAFLDRAGAFLAKDPLLNTVLISVTQRAVAEDGADLERDPRRPALVVGRGGGGLRRARRGDADRAGSTAPALPAADARRGCPRAGGSAGRARGRRRPSTGRSRRLGPVRRSWLG